MSRKAWISKVHERDGFKCMCCGDVNITFHHLIPKSEGGENISGNGISLCVECHEMVHKSTLNPIMFQPCFDARLSRVLVLRELMDLKRWEGFSSPECFVRHAFSKLPPLPEGFDAISEMPREKFQG